MRRRWRELRTSLAQPLRTRGLGGIVSGGPPYSRSFYGPLLVQRRGDVTYDYCLNGRYGRFTADIVEGQRSPFVFLDIGANIGLYSLVAARQPGCQGVLAFEPVPDTFRYLAANVALNRADKVQPFCGAVVADQATRFVSMAFDPAHSGLARMGTGAGPKAPAFSAAHLDDLLAQWPNLPILAKIDVEGAEAAVVEALAACPALPRLRGLVLEMSDGYHGGGGLKALTARLAELGFDEAARSGPGASYDAHFVRTREALPASS